MDLTGLTEKKTQRGAVYYVGRNGEVVAKRCTKCREIKCISKYHRRNRLGEHRSQCIPCAKDYYEKNKERKAKVMSTYYRENKERIAEWGAEYRRQNKAQILAKDARYRKENKEKIAKYKSGWAKENKDKRSIYYQRRRARKAALPDTLTNDQYAETLAYFGNACALTGEKLNLTQEHALPLAVGHGGTIRENMYPMVDRLNFSKGDRNIFEWFEANRQRFELSQARFDKLIAWLASANAMTVEEYRDYVYWCHANPRETVA